MGTVDVESASGAVLDDVVVTANGPLDGIEVGQTSASTLLLKNGTSVAGGTLVLGASGEKGIVVDIESASGATFGNVAVTAFDAASGIEVGQSGASTLLLKDGTAVKGGTVVVGVAGGSVDTIDVESGSGATFDDVMVTANGPLDGLEVGQAGAATLVLKNGTAVSGGTLVIGAAAGTGTVDVEGGLGATLGNVAVTAFDATNRIEVGQSGASTLLLKDGTSLKNATLVLGVSGGSVGTVDVESGSGAVFDAVVVTANGAADTVEVGQTSTATLLLEDGTSISGGALALGASGFEGTVDIESTPGATLAGIKVTAFDATNSIKVGTIRQLDAAAERHRLDCECDAGSGRCRQQRRHGRR